MDTADLDYPLPPDAIAQRPAEPRHAARLMVDGGPAAAPSHRTIADLADLVGPEDVVVRNVTRVLPARLRATRPTGGATEVLLLGPAVPTGARRDAGPAGPAELDGATRWEALVRPSRKLRAGTALRVAPGLDVVVGEDLGHGHRLVEVHAPGGLLAALDGAGEVPLPPYVTTPLADPERYQTVYASRPGSVAAPTAGLHLTDEVLGQIAGRGASIVDLELVVGLGTFRPIASAQVADHRMHAERYRVPAATLEACEHAARVIAIGTTTLRALESVARSGAPEGTTELFLHGSDRITAVDLLLTNFHQPRSSLLALIGAFVGPRWRALYDEALAEGYRFLSFGDAMLLRNEQG